MLYCILELISESKDGISGGGVKIFTDLHFDKEESSSKKRKKKKKKKIGDDQSEELSKKERLLQLKQEQVIFLFPL